MYIWNHEGKFRILKTGIPMHGIEVCDRVWKAFFALHIFFLEEDGLDTEWDVNRYLGKEGNHEECNLFHYFDGHQTTQ